MRAPAPAFAVDLNGETIALAATTLGVSLTESKDAVGAVTLPCTMGAQASTLENWRVTRMISAASVMPS